MQNTTRILTISILLACLIVLFIPAAAQEDEGGTIILGRNSQALMRPEDFSLSGYYCRHSSCTILNALMYVPLLGIDHETGWYAPNQPGTLAESWEFSQDNQVLTLHLRHDMFWSDGTPITSADVMMPYELNLNPDSALFGQYTIDHVESIFKKIEAPDDYTLVYTFTQGTCDAIKNVNYYGYALPAHIYHQLIDEVGYAGLESHKWLQSPDVVAGRFRFGDIAEDGTVTLLRNEDYHSNSLGYVQPEAFKQILVIEDEDTVTDMFWSKEINVLDEVPLDHRAAFIEAAAAGEIQVYEYPMDSWTFMAMNQADPNNPQPAVDENGNRIEQGLHPIFGDKLTRQAIAHAVDTQAIIDESLLGFGIQIPAHIVPNSWAYNFNLQPIPYEQDVAVSMLAEAGWIPENPILPASENNKLVCQDCLYAREVDSAFNGSYLEFELLVPNNQQERIIAGELIQEQLAQIGITVDLQVKASDEAFPALFQQTYDAMIATFTKDVQDAQTKDTFGVLADDPEQFGNNFVSFYNEAYYALEDTALTLPGCGLTERAEIYKQMQVIMQDEMPFVFLYANQGMYAAHNNVEGFNPYPSDLWWNVDTWFVHESD